MQTEGLNLQVPGRTLAVVPLGFGESVLQTFWRIGAIQGHIGYIGYPV